MRQEYLRCVVWDRTDKDKPKKCYRYVIVGMLVTDEPIESLSKNESVLDGMTFGLGDILSEIRQVKPKIRIGDANSVLCSLESLVDDDDDNPEEEIEGMEITTGDE